MTSTPLPANLPRPLPRTTRSRPGWLLIVLGLLAVLVQGILIGARAWREHVPQIETNSLADRDIITPTHLLVIDPEATAQARETEGQKLPPLFRWDVRLADQAIERFLQDYERRETLFRQGLLRKWAPPLSADVLQSSPFADYVTAFRLAHTDFPLADQMAADWAAESPARPIRSQTAAALREALRQYILTDEQSAEAAGHASVYLSPPADAGGAKSPDDLEQLASRVQRRYLIPLGKVRTQLQNELEAHGAAWAAYAAGFTVPNVMVDAEFTSAARAASAQNVHVEVAFQPGDLVIEKARPVTPVQAAALEALRAHYADRAQERTWTQWWLGGFGLVLIVSGGAANRTARRTRLSPALVDVVPAVPAETASAELAAVRKSLVQQLGTWLKLQFVQRLIHQRNEAVAAQATASEQVELLNDRLNKLHPEIRERVADYERRIAQLERELTTANEVSRELIKTKISLARKELEIEKARSNLVWN